MLGLLTGKHVIRLIIEAFIRQIILGTKPKGSRSTMDHAANLGSRLL